MAVTLSSNRSTVTWIQPKSLLPESSDEPSSGEDQTVAKVNTTPVIDPSIMPSDNISFDVRPLKTKGPALALQITFSENDYHIVTWIVAVRTRAGFRFDALNIASGFVEFVPCAPTPREQTALSVRLSGGLIANIVARPTFNDYTDFPFDPESVSPEEVEQEKTSGCPVRARVSWTPRRGFLVRQSPLHCTEKNRKRIVAIGPDGKITILKKTAQ